MRTLTMLVLFATVDRHSPTFSHPVSDKTSAPSHQAATQQRIYLHIEKNIAFILEYTAIDGSTVDIVIISHLLAVKIVIRKIK